MKTLFFAFIFCLFLCSLVAAQNREINIIPKPESLKRLNGEFRFSSRTKIYASGESGRKSAVILNDLLMKNYGFKLEYTDKPEKKNTIVILPKGYRIGSLPPEGYAEGYRLTVQPESILISASEAGQFYALQTLMQLLPVNFKNAAKLPAVAIADKPRFPYRGMHLDVARHFFPVEFVKKYIDLMSQYKFNSFHWHLTDDQGWRIEIKKYPKLTEIGSKRKESAKGRVLNPYVGDGVPVEGFYTQEQIKDVVAYAKAREITVIPEIELPGHSSAALAAYPNLGCKENYEYKVQTTWGIFKEVFCPKDETFQFLEDVLAETIELFPDSPYIHIGGDEVLKDFWKDSAFVQELKAKENLKDEHEVQSYFIQRIEKFINSKGKRIIGWDEILEGGLAPNATVMSWRGMKGGIEAAKAKHDVIMTPTDFAYLDYGQGNPKSEPINIGGFVTLQKVYSFEPVPKELTDEEKKYILGGQGNVWTEYLKKPENVEYMVFPRMLAMSEALWSQPENRNFDDFQKRLSHHFALLDRQNINYRIPEPVGLQNVLLTGERDAAEINLNSLLPNGKVFYTTDGSEPTEKSSVYAKPFKLALKPNEKIDLRTIVVSGKGRKSVVYSAFFWRREPLKADDFQSGTSGMDFSFYKGTFKSVKDFLFTKPVKTGDTKSFDLKQFGEKENFGVIFDAYVNIPADGIYEFFLESKDGAVLMIGEETVIDLDGLHEKKNAVGEMPLAKGFHRFQLKFFHTTGDISLNMRFGLKGQPLRGFGGQLFR